jgi:hypothetical protein
VGPRAGLDGCGKVPRSGFDPRSVQSEAIRYIPAPNRNEYQGYLLEGKDGRFVGLTTLPPSCADCLKILVVSTHETPEIGKKKCI